MSTPEKDRRPGSGEVLGLVAIALLAGGLVGYYANEAGVFERDSSDNVLVPTVEASATDDLIDFDPRRVFYGELPFNQYLEGGLFDAEPNPVTLLSDIKDMFKDQGMSDPNPDLDYEDKGNALLTSLTNPFNESRPDYVPGNPDEETGMGHDAVDITRYTTSDSIVSVLDGTRPSEIFYHNQETGQYTFGMMSWGHDRDFSATMLAIGIASVENRDLFEKDNGEEMTLDEVLDSLSTNAEIRSEVLQIRAEILGQVQDEELQVSQEELNRRRDEDDYSELLGPYVGSDQWESCDIEMNQADTREGQRQVSRRVEHVYDGQETRTSADSGEEAILMVGTITIDENGILVWDVDGFTGRGYEPYLNSSVGQEMLPCGEAVFTPTPTSTPEKPEERVPTSTPQPPTSTPQNTPTRTPESTPTPVLTNTHSVDNTTSTPQPTSTDMPID